MARYIAKNVVAAGLADQCEVQISYAIGVAQPICVLVNTSETGKLPDEQILELVKANFDMRPRRNHRHTQPAKTNLQENRMLRPLRSRRRRIPMGKMRQSRDTQERSSCLQESISFLFFSFYYYFLLVFEVLLFGM